jgi:tripartite-type tricarboxylate transporter receptor subunit TctC
VTALMRGDVQIACLPAIAVTPQLGSGQIKILAISTAERDPLLPGIPTLKEQGIDVEADAWMGLVAPAKTPEPLIARIGKAFAAAITSPAIREKLATQLMSPVPTTPAQFRARVDADLARWTPVVKAADVRIN